jgi:two-component system CheB/CheR fusion protein
MKKQKGGAAGKGGDQRKEADKASRDPEDPAKPTSPMDEKVPEILPDPLERQPFFVVGLGASAGGLETLEQFFSNMPPDSGMAFVVVVHLDPTHKTLLPELLARYTRMEVCPVEEGMAVEPNMVYVIPANRDMTVNGCQFHLEEPQAPRGMRHTIDVFLRSLAADMEENAIAVILSGTGTDGTQGVKAVKEVGGFVVVQEESTAKYPGMPQSAIATGVVDLILPTKLIPDKILELAQRSTLLARRKEAEPAKHAAEELKAIFRIVNSRTGHDFSSYKTSTIIRRIERRMAVNDIIDIRDYIRFLKEKPDESKALFKEFLIGVTSFFRDPEAFEALEKRVIPQLFEDRDPDDPLRIWMAGCATGEEAYSIGMLIREYSREQRLDLKVQIFATDIDGEAVDFARAGRFPDSIGADVTPERLRTFFKKTDSTYQVVKPLREMIVFAQHNLIKDPPFSRLDLLVCRNLLIYLNPELQKRILPLFAQAIKPTGHLFLGSSETVGGFTDLFLPLDKKWKIFQRRETGRRLGIEFPFAPQRSPIPEGEPVQTYREVGISPGILAEKTLMQRYSPPCVVINEKFEVVYFSTRTSRYLEPPVGEPSQNILKMAKEDLRPALRAAVHKALTEQQTAIYKGLKIITETGAETLDLRVEPITTPPSAKGLALVIFEPTGTVQLAAPVTAEKPEPPEEDESSTDLMVQQLEEQLRITNEQLQSTTERMETSNEELKSSNEELMSMNEEFQSTNEELETSKEELQALNEELVTVNAELQNKVDELGQTNSDLQNFLSSTDIATIFLDRQFRVKRFSPAMAKLFNLISGDIGRPLQHFAGTINYPDLEKDAEKVLEKLTPIEREVSAPDRKHHYLVRVLPYRTMEDVIDGVVVTFVDFTERKRVEETRDRLASIVENSTDAIIGKTMEGKIISWNRGAEQMYGYTSGEAIGKNISFIAPPEKNNELAGILGKLKKGERVEHMETVRRCKDGRLIDVSLVVSPILDEGGRVVGASSISRDITDRKEMEKALRESAKEERARAAELKAIMEAVPAAVLVSHDPQCRIITGNQAAYQLLRMPPGSNTSKSNPDAPAAHFRIFHDGQELPAEKLPLQMAAASGEPILDFDEEILFENGDRVSVYGNAVPLKDSSGKPAGVVAAFVDITPRVQAEEEICRARQAAEAANQAKSDFLANMSHEIRNPLTGIFGMLELLGKTRLDEQQQKYREIAENSGKTLLRVINDILDFSKIEAGKMEIASRPFNLHRCIESAVEIFTLEAEKRNLALGFTFPPNIQEEVVGDFSRVHQIMFNLIGNALKFTESGSIDVSVSVQKDVKGKGSGKRTYRIKVADTGIGIPPKKQAQIFESFTQLEGSYSRSYGGSGLGLAISRRLLEQMGGSIEVQSEVDKGSVFTVTIPLGIPGGDKSSQGDKAGGAGAIDAAKKVAPGDEPFRILLAEDDPINQDLLKTILALKGYEVITANNGEEAVDTWEEGGAAFILMDVQMPVMDGLTAISRIRELEGKTGSRIPIVCLTAHAFEEDRNRCLDAGADGYLSKPLLMEELQKVIELLRK